jgi:hypothetical protein
MTKTVMTSALMALGVTALSGSAKADDSKFFAETQFGGGTAGALSYQVIPNLYVGAGLGFGWASVHDNRSKLGAASTGYAVGPMVSYAHGLSDSLVLWPRLALNWGASSTTVTNDGTEVKAAAEAKDGLTLDLSLPLFVKAGGLHFGPSLDYGMALSSSETKGETTTQGDGSSMSLGLSFRAGLSF